MEDRILTASLSGLPSPPPLTRALVHTVIVEPAAPSSSDGTNGAALDQDPVQGGSNVVAIRLEHETLAAKEEDAMVDHAAPPVYDSSGPTTAHPFSVASGSGGARCVHNALRHDVVQRLQSPVHHVRRRVDLDVAAVARLRARVMSPLPDSPRASLEDVSDVADGHPLLPVTGGGAPPHTVASDGGGCQRVGRLIPYDVEDASDAATWRHDSRRTNASATLGDAATSLGLGGRAPHPTAAQLPVPLAHVASENWGMVRRFGFPCSADAMVCDAEHQACRMIEAQHNTCEAQWSSALKGVPLLANATDETSQPLRKLCLKYGIPGHLRGIVWLTLSGVALRMEENDRFCATLLHRFGIAADAEAADAIEKDLDRTFPNHPYYAATDIGQAKLRRVLHALCWRNPLLNYCQSFNFLAATTLLVTDDEDATFWLMALLLETILPNDYYGEGLVGVKVDQEVVEALLGSDLPKLAHHFTAMRFDVRALVPAWLLSMFVNTFPIDTVIRIWDVVITHASTSCVGSSSSPHHHHHGGGGAGAFVGGRSAFPIAVLLGFLKMHQEALLALDDAGETMQFLQRAACTCFDKERLIKSALSVNLGVERLHALRRQCKVLVRQHEAGKAAARRAYQENARERQRKLRLYGPQGGTAARGKVTESDAPAVTPTSATSPLWKTAPLHVVGHPTTSDDRASFGFDDAMRVEAPRHRDDEEPLDDATELVEMQPLGADGTTTVLLGGRDLPL